MEKKKRSSIILKFFSKHIIKIGIIAAVIIIGAGGTAIGYRKHIFSESKTTKIGFESIGEMATQSAYCTELNVTDASKTLFGVKIPFTQSKYIYSYDVIVKAGFDFGEIKWSIHDKKIEVKLPEERILSSDIDLNSFKVYHEEESIFNRITMMENNEAVKELKRSAEEKAVSNGLLKNARSNAESILTSFFGNVYDLKEYTISFTDS